MGWRGLKDLRFIRGVLAMDWFERYHKDGVPDTVESIRVIEKSCVQDENACNLMRKTDSHWEP
jgi:hypothetical protein